MGDDGAQGLGEFFAAADALGQELRGNRSVSPGAADIVEALAAMGRERWASDAGDPVAVARALACHLPSWWPGAGAELDAVVRGWERRRAARQPAVGTVAVRGDVL